LVSMTSTVGSRIEGCIIDANAPAPGNWISGLAPNGNTANAVIRDVTITGATKYGIDWQFANQGRNKHNNLQVENVFVINTGYVGAAFYGLYNGSRISGMKIYSTGFNGFTTHNNIDLTVDRLYVNKVNPPTVIYAGSDTEQPNHGTSSTGL